MRQKDAFLAGEGDAWFERNASAGQSDRLPEGDRLVRELLTLTSPALSGASVLEIGCGEGRRLGWLKEHAGSRCSGIEPSTRAVDAAMSRGVDAKVGTADQLPFADSEFDIVIFGFCLYLCDRSDLFRVACEADRVLKSPGWLLIQDFYSPDAAKRKYHHREGLFSYRLDYRSLFLWHPAYMTYAHRVEHHVLGGFTDDANEWVATSILRKNLERCE